MTILTIVLLLLVAALAAAAGYFIAHQRAQQRLSELGAENTRLAASLESEARIRQAEIKAVETARTQLTDTFTALAGRALSQNTQDFLKLAEQNLKQFQIQAQAGLERKEQAIAHLIQPVKEALEKTAQQIHLMEQERQKAYGSLSQHLNSLLQSQQQLQHETRSLVQALRRPEVRGQWGELTLKRLAELAGMVEYCDFYPQEQIDTEEGALRPDMVVRMPDQREIVVDAKTPLDAYLSALDAKDEQERDGALARHARNLRERVRELAGKAYWSQFPRSPDFVVLFIPGDQFLAAALEQDPALLEDALRDKIILATPTSFVALLRAVAYGWRQLAVAENAEKIRELGQELYKRLGVFTEHLVKLGKSLSGSVEAYNKAVGSLEHQVLPGARRFTNMGIGFKKEIEEVGFVEKITRVPESEESAEKPHK
ncbi:MAG: DNA recombination protein RmuC [Gammaproteobacteria bacterium]|nr:DNA recombination protein RmuC [Gammaproteobacteria bacterium]